jgi:uncharacterized protein
MLRTMDTNGSPPSLIEYPCDFPIKVMGLVHPDFVSTITAVIQAHDPDFDPATLTLRPSSKGRYLGLTGTVRAVSRAQLDALYTALSQHPMVKVVL